MRMAVTRAKIRLGGVLLLACVLFAGTALGDDGPPRISVLIYYSDAGGEITDEYLDEDWAKYRYRPPPPHVRLALQIARRLARHGFEFVGLNAHERTRQIYNRLGEMAPEDAPLVAGELARMLMVDVVYLVRFDLVDIWSTDDGYCWAQGYVQGEGYDSAAHRIDAWANTLHKAARRECDRAIIDVVDGASASVGRVLGVWKSTQQSAESDASAEDTGASSSGSGGNGRAAEISPTPIDVRLEGATSYEIAEVFGRVVGAARGVTDATLYKMKFQGANPRESNVTWRVRVENWELYRFQANVMKVLHAISEEEDRIVREGACTRSERDLLRAIRPGDSSSGTVVFVFDRDRLQEPC